MALSKEEIELLRKVGVSDTALQTLTKKPSRVKVHKVEDHKTITIDLVLHSGVVTRNCLCCGATTTTYVDYLKRHGEEGYVMKTVERPSCIVTQQHYYEVIECKHCLQDDLVKMESEKLAKMIGRLRNKIYSNV